MKNWRLITDDQVSSSLGLAVDETLAQRVGTGESSAMLRLYTYKSYCALVGRFQNAENELHLTYCRNNNIPVNRRPTGGGAIIMGHDQLGIALAIPGKSRDTYSRAREMMATFSNGIVMGLNSLGVNAEFRRKNDIEVDGRKLVGLGIYKAPSGGLLFHASVLVDLDVEFMLNVLNTPFEKITDKEINRVSSRTSTVRQEVGKNISLDEVREEIAKGYAEVFGVELHQSEFSIEEIAAANELEQKKYSTDEWVFQTTKVPDTFGSAKLKTPAGLLDIRTTLAGATIKSVFIGGDFFAAEHAVADLEASLRWHSSDPKAVAATLDSIYTRRQNDLNNLPLTSLVEGVQKSIRRARIAENKVRSDPYGCFVTPAGALDG